MSKLNKCICGNCKYYDPDLCLCTASGEFELYPDDTCDEWEDDNEPIKNTKVTFLRLDKGE